MLAQSGVPSTYPIQVGEYRGTVQDVIQYEMASCKVKTELTFKLIALSHYLASDYTWRTSDGRRMEHRQVGREELAQPVNGCGLWRYASTDGIDLLCSTPTGARIAN